jgi:hypothetical protein
VAATETEFCADVEMDTSTFPIIFISVGSFGTLQQRLSGVDAMCRFE